MSATRDLIAAALTAADLIEETIPYFHVTEELRELCARAMVQPNMAEVERLLEAYDREYASGGSVEDYDRARTALLDYVRGVVIALKIKTEEHDCCAEDLIALRSEAAQRPAGGVAIAQVIESGDYEAKVQWLLNPLPVGSVLYEEAPQSVSTAEVPMPDVHDYGYSDSDIGWVETLACDEADVRTYGDAREAAVWAKVAKALNLGTGMRFAESYLLAQIAECAALEDDLMLAYLDGEAKGYARGLRGEVKP